MSESTLKLIVATIAALAVIVAALIGLWKDRKGRREVLLQDLEILDKLPSPSLNHIALSAYIDKRVLLLAVEDKVSLYLFCGITLSVALVSLVVALAVGVAADRMTLSITVAAGILAVAVLLIGYRIVRTKWTEQLREQLKSSSHDAAKQLIRESIDPAGVALLSRLRDKLPDSFQDKVMQKAQPAIDAEMDKITDELVNSVLANNRYHEWSPPKTSTRLSRFKARIAVIRLDYYSAILRILSALMEKIQDMNDQPLTSKGMSYAETETSPDR